MNDKKLLINALLLILCALGIVYSFRLIHNQKIDSSVSISSSSQDMIDWSTLSSQPSALEVVSVANQSSNLQASSQISSIRNFKGASVVDTTLPIVRELNLKPRYILKYLDMYLINLGSYWNLEGISRAVTNLYGGVNIQTPSQIQQYKLPGQKVAFINIPQYKDTYVYMTIYDGKDFWLLQVPASSYQSQKPTLKALFEQ